MFRGVVYLIKNTKTNKVYIGQTVVPSKKRWQNHRYRLNKGTHTNPYLLSAWKKYGAKSFTFTVLDNTFQTQKELDAAETYYIQSYKSQNRIYGYNLKDGGANGRMSNETRSRISVAQKKRYENPIEYKNQLTRMKVLYTTTLNENRSRKLRAFYKNKSNRKRLLGQLHSVAHLGGKKLQRTYKGFVSPLGDIYSPVVGLMDFCREHNLNERHMVEVNQGKRKHHKGWTSL